MKRILDFLLALAALCLLSPLFLLLSFVIRLQDPGPVFYISQRAGKDGRSFSFYKFRTMRSGIETGAFITPEDRVLPCGFWMRRFKLDELPQLINILKGDMSIVGPRPMLADTVHLLYSGKYEPVIRVRPGLTSPASLYDYVVGDRCRDEALYRKTILPVKLELELYYTEHQSLIYDAALILRTVCAIFLTLFGKESEKLIPELKKIRADAAGKTRGPAQ